MLSPKLCHCLPNGKAYELGGQMEERKDPYRRQALRSPRSKVKVSRSRGASDRCWPISRPSHGQ